MGTVRGGKIVCDKCGVECTALHGFAMTVNRVANFHNDSVKAITDDVSSTYGKHDFIICWKCTIEMMGIPTLGEQRAARAREGKIKKEEPKNANGNEGSQNVQGSS